MAKINWYNGKTANSASDMQKLCDTVNRSLLTPESAPADTKIVAVDNTNSQKMLTIGDGLSIENDTLKTSASGGEKLYLHNIKFTKPNTNTFNVVTNVITKNSDLFTIQSFYEYLTNNGFIDNGLNVNGINGSTTASFTLFTQLKAKVETNQYLFDGLDMVLSEGKFSYSGSGEIFNIDITQINLVDTVIEL